MTGCRKGIREGNRKAATNLWCIGQRKQRRREKGSVENIKIPKKKTWVEIVCRVGIRAWEGKGRRWDRGGMRQAHDRTLKKSIDCLGSGAPFPAWVNPYAPAEPYGCTPFP